MVFRRARLCSDSGVVEAKYEIKDVSLRLEAYDDARSCKYTQTVKCERKKLQFYMHLLLAKVWIQCRLEGKIKPEQHMTVLIAYASPLTVKKTVIVLIRGLKIE